MKGISGNMVYAVIVLVLLLVAFLLIFNQNSGIFNTLGQLATNMFKGISG